METDLVEPCDICGDIGYDELIVTCCKCRKTRKHVYCMQNFAIKIPEEWICEACTSGEGNASPRHGGKEAFKYSYDMLNFDIPNGCSKVCNNLTKHDLLKMQKSGKVKFLDAEEVIKLASGATKKGSPSKVSFNYRSGFSSVSTEFSSLERGSPSKVNFSSRPGLPSVTPKFPSSMSKPRARIVPVDLTNSFGGRKMQLTPVADQQASKEKEALVNPAKDSSSKALQTASLDPEGKGGKTGTTVLPTVDVAICYANEKKATTGTSCTSSALFSGLPTTVALVDSSEYQCCRELDVLSSKQAGSGIEKTMDKASHTPPPSRLYSPSLGSGSNSCTVAEQKILDAQKGYPLHVLPKLRLYQPYLPAVHATWRGGFKFSGDATAGQFYGGFQAQPASRVHRKAYEFSQKMPIILEVQLLPQCHALVDLFHNDYPEIADIALYFFPSSNIARSKENIHNLFELLEMKNSVIRSCFASVELLIFSSRQLHMDSQYFLSRSCTGSFLWGVFHNVKNNKFCKTQLECSSTASPTQCQHFENSNMDCGESIDMEIDMVGGKACGRTDVAVSKTLSGRSRRELDKESVGNFEDSEEHILNESFPLRVHLCSEQTQQNIVHLYTETAQKIKDGLVSARPLQSSLSKLSDPIDEADIPPGFEAMLSRQACRHLQ